MVEAKLEQLQVRRRLGAGEVCSLIRGYREKKPSLKRIYRDLTNDTRVELSPGLQEMLDESHERVARENPEARAKQLDLKLTEEFEEVHSGD